MERISIAFLGDIHLGDRARIGLHPAVVDVLASADLVVANQEGPITRHDRHVQGKCLLRSAPESAQLLRSWGVDVVSLANNHTFDFGWEGFEQTRRSLSDAGVSYLGAGENLDEASVPLVREVKGMRVGFLAYSWELVQTRCATQEAFGCAPLDSEMMTRQIEDLSGRVDTVVVMPHWGYCDYVLPLPRQVALGRQLMRVGATAIVGHHSHVIQGSLRCGDSLTAFSLGNFAFEPYEDRGRLARFSRDNLEGMILKLDIEGGNVIASNVVFTRQTAGEIAIDDLPRRRNKMARRCAAIAVENYDRRWKRYVRLRMLGRLIHHANIMNWRSIRRETLRGGWLAVKEAFGRNR